MSADFPLSVKNFLQLQDGVDSVVAQHPNDRGDEITAIQTLLGALGSAQSYSDNYKNVLRSYRRGCLLDYKGVADLYVRSGEIAIYDASGNVRLRRNTTDTTVTWADIDTGAEANSTQYYVYAVADTAASTFTVVISTNATTPTDCTYYRRIGSFYNNGSGTITRIIDDFYKFFGAWEDKTSSHAAQQATKNGFVLGYGSTGAGAEAKVYTDTESDPTTLREDILNDAGTATGQLLSFCCPVIKGDFWKITGSVTAVYWIPIGD